MKLVDEIEAAAKSGPLPGGSTGDQIICRQVAQSLVQCDYWPRIRAALLAGEEMAEWIVSEDECGKGVASIALANAFRFRAATEGTK